jgi:hypothetical protein
LRRIPAMPGISSMCAGGPVPTVDRLIDRPKEPTVRKSLVISLVAVALILLTAWATLVVLSAVAGQESGLERSMHRMPDRAVM